MPPEEMQIEDVRFFVVGHAKSGTTWLERTLGTHPEVLCKGAGLFFGRNTESVAGFRVLHEVLASCEGLRTWHDQGSPNLWTEAHTFEEDVAQITRAAIDALMRRELTISGKRVLGDRTPFHFTQLQEISTFYPQARIIHALRDGRDVMVSLVHNRWRAARWAGSAVKLSPKDAKKRDSYIEDPESFITGGHSIFTEQRLRNRARRWRCTVRQAQQMGKRLFGDNYFEVRYEDHLHRPHETLAELFRFLGVGAESEVIEAVVEENSFEKVSGRPRGQESSSNFLRKGISGDWVEVFTKGDKRVFKEEAGDLLVELGYEKNSNW